MYRIFPLTCVHVYVGGTFYRSSTRLNYNNDVFEGVEEDSNNKRNELVVATVQLSFEQRYCNAWQLELK